MSKQRAPSKTVNLSGITSNEMHALTFTAWKVELAGKLPRTAIPALKRLQAGVYLETISKVPRKSLESLAEAIRPFVAHGRSVPGSRAAFAKLDARLSSTPGRPAAPGMWDARAKEAKRVAQQFKRDNGRAATDAEIESALKWAPGILRKWRNYKPGLFPPPSI